MSDAIATCSCQRVRIELSFPTRFVAHCHCANCRRAHGAAFVTFAGFPEEQVSVVTGADDLTHYLGDTESTRSFCGVCGTTLLFRGPRWPGEVHVSAANVEGELDRTPHAHAYADRTPGWCPILDDLPRYGGESGTEPLA